MMKCGGWRDDGRVSRTRRVQHLDSSFLAMQPFRCCQSRVESTNSNLLVACCHRGIHYDDKTRYVWSWCVKDPINAVAFHEMRVQVRFLFIHI